MTEARNTAGVVVPPPLVALGAVIVGLALDWLFPAYVLSALLTRNGRIIIGVLLIAAGIAIGLAGRGIFVRFGTNVNPYRPSNVLVTTGIFAYVRNPMYVGLALLVAGIGVALASDWTLVMLRCRQTRRTLSRGQIWRRLPQLYGHRAALRLAVLNQVNVQAFPAFVPLPRRSWVFIGNAEPIRRDIPHAHPGRNYRRGTGRSYARAAAAYAGH